MMLDRKQQDGFTLIEVLIVVVIVAILAAVVVQYATVSKEDAELASARRTLQALRGQAELVKHFGISATGTEYGSYLGEHTTPMNMPINPLTGKKFVKTIFTEKASESDLTPASGGWIYSSTSKTFWIDKEGCLEY